jgi:hypothetical protein
VQAIKALQDKLSETRAAVEPRPKFSFKTKKNASAVSLADAAQLAVEGRRRIPGYSSPGASSSVSSSAGQTPNYPSTPLNEPDRQLQPRAEIAPTSIPEMEFGTSSEKPTGERSNPFAATSVSSVSVNNHYGLHIMLPASGSTATVPASITSLRHCVVDMSIPTADGKPYASLAVKGVKESLLVCGQIDGPAHITGVEHSIIVVTCRQFRMHNCADVDVYLSSSSNPIIEDCTNIRFGRIPRVYVCCPAAVHSHSEMLTIYHRHSIMTARTVRTAGTRWKTLNGSSPNRAPTGVSSAKKMRFRSKYGQRLSPAALVGPWMISCGQLTL